MFNLSTIVSVIAALVVATIVGQSAASLMSEVSSAVAVATHQKG